MSTEHEEAAKSAMPRAPGLAQRMMSPELTARKSVAIIASTTVFIAIVGALLMRVFDKQDFKSIGDALWFSLQTVTTVGYGDVVPHDAQGRIIAAFILLAGVGFIAVVTAAVTAALVEGVRRAPRQAQEERLERYLQDITTRLAALEGALSQNRPSSDRP